MHTDTSLGFSETGLSQTPSAPAGLSPNIDWAILPLTCLKVGIFICQVRNTAYVFINN